MNEANSALEIELVPLQSWKNTPEVKDLKQDFQDAKPIHDNQVTKLTEYQDNMNGTGKAKVDTPQGNSKIVPKLIRKQAEWRYASLSEPFLSTEDLFNVSPATWADRKAAQQNELVLNHQFNVAIDKVSFIDEYIRAAVDDGTVIVRVGWDFEEEEYEGTFPQVEYRINPDYSPMHEQLAQLKAENPSKYEAEVPEELKQAHEMSLEQQQAIQPVVIGQITEKRMRTIRNVPTVEVCDARNVVIDPSCNGDVKKAGFMIYSFESSLSELKKDKKYKNLERIQVNTNSILGEPDHKASEGSKNFQFSDEPRKKFVVHEYWGFRDIHGTGIVVPIVAAWVGNVMIRLEENPFPDKALPFVVRQYLPKRKELYGEPDGALLEDNQKIIGAVTRGMIDIMAKSANGQTGVRKDMLDATNRRKFDKGQDYEFNMNVDPRQGVFMHTYPEIPQSAQFMLMMQNQEAESMTGVKSFSQGVSGQSLGDVAVGVRGALDAASKRELGILRRLSSGIIEIGRKFISMNGEFLSKKEVIRITDEEYVTVLRDDLAGNFDLKLSISTAEEDNNKAEKLAFMLQTVGPNTDPEVMKMILSDICRLRKLPELAKKIETYQPQPDPLAKRKAELEIELLEAQVANEKATALKNQTSAQLNVAKTGTEGAKAENLSADTDNKNLDFVEQESGVKQERDKELHGEQARSQMALKLLDHTFTSQEKELDRKAKAK